MDRPEMPDYDGEVKASVEPRYTCPATGAHFNFHNMCERLMKIFDD